MGVLPPLPPSSPLCSLSMALLGRFSPLLPPSLSPLAAHGLECPLKHLCPPLGSLTPSCSSLASSCPSLAPSVANGLCRYHSPSLCPLDPAFRPVGAAAFGGWQKVASRSQLPPPSLAFKSSTPYAPVWCKAASPRLVSYCYKFVCIFAGFVVKLFLHFFCTF